MAEILFKYENWGTNIFPASTNMALEEFMIRRIAEIPENRHVAAVRFYSFPYDSIVLGYAQAPDVIKRLNGAGLTRRMTGGSHVQTGPNTLAYSFVVPRDGTFTTYEDMRAYFAERVANALQNIGIHGDIEVDNKASTINVDERVIASHAIFWGVKSALLHGLIMLSSYDIERLASRVALQQRMIGGHLYREYDALKALPSITSTLNGGAHDIGDLNLLRGVVSNAVLQEVAGDDHEQKEITNPIIQQALVFGRYRYNVPIWINTHHPTFTREEVEDIPGEELNGSLRERLGYCLFIQVPDEDFKKMAEPVE